MGASFSIKKYLNNISDDLAIKIENLIPWIKTLDINIGSIEEDIVGDIKAIKVVKDRAKLDRAYNIVKNEQEATNFLIKKPHWCSFATSTLLKLKNKKERLQRG